ncbi:hypothetical protein [Siminovitchia acidinfaciens]|uniref:hypothetical protein n=1 Tax=Siminovitchia acidinfaciens TaxID=2321395 RepID=UPI0013E0D835|nr:hypothetical protein [Siminovitchia acidinfaciens]
MWKEGRFSRGLDLSLWRVVRIGGNFEQDIRKVDYWTVFVISGQYFEKADSIYDLWIVF